MKVPLLLGDPIELYSKVEIGILFFTNISPSTNISEIKEDSKIKIGLQLVSDSSIMIIIIHSSNKHIGGRVKISK